MFKCPNCGSTAQIEIVGIYDTTYPSMQEIFMRCGCGCHFSACAVIDPNKTYIEKATKA